MSNPNHSDADRLARTKDVARESRLSFKNRAEHLLRADLKEEARAKCRDYIAAFANCAQEQGLWVVFRCQDKLKDLNECMAIHNSEEVWQKYKEDHKEELAIRAKGGRV